MSDWTHTLTVIVPELLMVQANQLALAIGTSDDDVNTFQSADWTDGTDNFAVCSTRAVDKIFDYVGMVDTSGNTLLAEGLAALSFVTVTTDETGAQTITGNDHAKIRVLVDMEPFAALSLFGLHRKSRPLNDGNAQAGTSSRESGFTIYPKNTGFEAKVTNLSSASNDIKVTLEFAEIPSSVATS